MKKALLVLFILADLVIMAGAAFLLYMHLKPRFPANFPIFGKASSAPVGNPRPAAPPASTGLLTSPLAPPASTPGMAASGSRNIGFSYRNSHAKKVSIRADFTGWKADAMHQGSHGVWTYQISLTPGEYAYVFAVDNKPPFNDPNNKHTKRIGTTLVSSIIVKPAAAH